MTGHQFIEKAIIAVIGCVHGNQQPRTALGVVFNGLLTGLLMAPVYLPKGGNSQR